MKDDLTNKPLLEQLFGKFFSTLSPSFNQKRISEHGRELMRLLERDGGWEEFLRRVGSRTFSASFSEFHAEFWNWYWELTRLRSLGANLSQKTLTFLAGWGRGMGKSSNVEWACIVEGAMCLEGYVLYVSETQSSANSHVAEIRQRIESEEIAQAFPHLANPKIGRHGNQYGWKQDFLITEGGWAIRPVGLDVAVRGLRQGDIRPTLIVLDDIDSHNASLAVREDNLKIISKSILPTGTKNTIKLIAQNLISEEAIVNQIYTGKTDVLADHIPSVYPAFRDLRVETEIDEKGKTRNRIKQATPTWAEFDIEAAQRFLNDSGLEAFMSEYQHDFSLDRQDLVIPEYLDYPTHVISWSQFKEKFGTVGRVPDHWMTGMGLDIGYTASHLSAWTWMAVAAEDSYLPNATFRYRGLTFEGKSIDEQAIEVMRILTAPPRGENRTREIDQLSISKMSHEKLGERITLNRNYSFNFTECNFKREDGVPQWRNILRVDYRQPHPFHPDEINPETGLYRLGRPNYFDVVADAELAAPRTDAGLAIQRTQLSSWKRRKVTLSNSGLQDSIPMKLEDDTIDSARMILATNSLTATPLTSMQRVERSLREGIAPEDVAARQGQDDFPEILLARAMALAEAKKREQERLDRVTASVLRVAGGAGKVSPRFRRKQRKSILW